jgi:molecular chaperone DnaK
MAYAKTSRDAEEYFTASFTGVAPGMQYRIQRGDGGFDTGVKQLTERIAEMLPLLPNVNNIFRLIVSDNAGNNISAGIPQIEINHGKFNIEGQPLPSDICIEVDDPVNKTTKLEVIFEKNNILPLRKTIVREAGKIVRKDSQESIVINVLEGARYAMPSSNLPIGIIEIKGNLLQQDLVKGSDIEIMLEMNESRDLKVAVTLLMNDQEFANVFTPSARQVSIDRLRGELKDLVYDARIQRNSAEAHENYELAAQAQMILEEAERCYDRVQQLQQDDVTDEKYQLEERKRTLARQLDSMTRETGIQELIDEYLGERNYAEELFREHNDQARLEKLSRITEHEEQFLAGQGMYIIRGKINEIRRLSWEIRKNDPESLISAYYYYAHEPQEKYTDPRAAQEYLELCDKAIERQNYKELLVLLQRLHNLYKDDTIRENFHGTGLH